MSSKSSKRQHARNEKVIQDLIKSVNGNDRCADCGANNTGWASWNLGIFLCVRCASLHRKLGTHISKVKSTTMDKWENDQVDNMKKIGNLKSNAYYNPDTRKHPPPVSQIDDSDSHMERHIRAKYEYQTYRRDQSEPKASSAVAAYSSGATLGASLNPANISPPASSHSTHKKSGFRGLFRSSSPAASNQNAKSMSGPIVFPHGMAQPTPLELYGDQIKNLREMGFTNVTQCIEVLKQVDGRMMDAVEVLVRLNKDNDKRPDPPPKTQALTVHKSGPPAVTRQRTGGSSNPFDALDKEQQPLPPLPAVKTGPSGQMNGMNGYGMQQPPMPGMQNGYPQQQGLFPQTQYQNLQQQSTGYQQQQFQQQQFQQQQAAANPFGPLQSALPQQQQQQSPFAPLSPQHTSSPFAPLQQQQQQQSPFAPLQSQQQQQQQSPFGPLQGQQAQQQQQSPFAPLQAPQPFVPMPTGGSNSFNPFVSALPAIPTTNPYSQQPLMATATGASGGFNPFGPQPQQQQQQGSSPFSPVQQQGNSPFSQQPQQQQITGNPYGQPSSLLSQPTGYGQPQQQQQMMPQPSGMSQFSPQATGYGQQPQQQQQQQNGFQQQQFGQPQPPQQQPMRTGFDKNSILALYNAPQLAPPRSQMQIQVTGSQVQQQQQEPQQQAPSAGSNNPFLPGGGPQQGQQGQQNGVQGMNGMGANGMNGMGQGHQRAKESVDFGAWQSGRHSPDAFASLAFGGR
ncbi:hypothetical protein FPQ18DRAFT_357638 [Pyronema domesticum]|nr:hypothetical protein FPQ18DRAFT_357638 [Pyronema domesticum]